MVHYNTYPQLAHYEQWRRDAKQTNDHSPARIEGVPPYKPRAVNGRNFALVLWRVAAVKHF